MPSVFDALVVGGGPAGSIAAIELAKLGWRVRLVERGGWFRDKACGHCLNPRAIELLGEINLLEGVRAIVSGNTNRFRVHSVDGGFSEVQLERPGWLVPRHTFDQLLRDAAASHGVDVSHDASATEFEFDDEVAAVRIRSRDGFQTVRTRLLIGADGLGSAMARAAGLCDGRMQGRKLGFSFDWQSQRTELLDERAIHMYLDSGGGYLGAVRQADQSIHLAGLIQPARGSKSRSTARRPVEWVRSLAKDHATLRDLSLHQCRLEAMLRFRAVGPMPWRTTAVSGPRVALVGDAAGYVEPFTGEGMTWAIQSAITLADCIRNCAPGRWDAAVAVRYQQAWRNSIESRQRICRGLALALERPRVSQFMFHLGGRFPRLSRAIARQVVAS